MFFEIQFTEAVLVSTGLLVLHSVFLKSKLRSLETTPSDMVPNIEEPLADLTIVEDAPLPSSLGVIEAMLLEIASGSNVMDAAKAYGFTEDEARVALACYEI